MTSALDSNDTPRRRRGPRPPRWRLGIPRRVHVRECRSCKRTAINPAGRCALHRKALCRWRDHWTEEVPTQKGPRR